MKVSFAVALLATCASANWISEVQRFYGFLKNHNIPVTRHDIHKYQKKKHRNGFKKHQNHDMIMEQATHSVRASRERLGLPKVQQGGGDGSSEYESLNGFAGRLLGLAQGFEYSTSGGGNSVCFTSIESLLIVADNGTSIFTKLWAPWYWAEMQLTLQDFIALYAGFYTECDINKFFNSMSHLATAEGVSEMGARATGAFFFQYKQYQKDIAVPNASGFQKGRSLGGLMATITDYHI